MPTPAMTMIDQLRSDFNLPPTRTEAAKPLVVGENTYEFTLKNIHNRKDRMWIARSSNTVFETDMKAVYYNLAVHEGGVAARCVVAINGNPLWKAVGLPLEEEDIARIKNDMNPPDDIADAACVMWYEFLTSDSTDGDFVVFLKQEHDRLFPGGTIDYTGSKVDKAGNHVFKCNGCHYVQRIPDAEIMTFEKTLKANGHIFCSKCAEIAVPPKGEEVETKGSPLQMRLYGEQ